MGRDKRYDEGDKPSGLPQSLMAPDGLSEAATEVPIAPTLAAGSETPLPPGLSDHGDLGSERTWPAAGPRDAPDVEFGQHFVRGPEIARGGMGRIIRAQDLRLGRPVAIKELLVSTPSLERRFEREIQITARLQHPAIIAVYEAGRLPSGVPFFSMKEVVGQPFDKVIRATESMADRLALLPSVIAVADALSYAHDRHIIHRDLKPGNVLVGDYGETVVIDWGLAKDLSSEPNDDFDVGDSAQPSAPSDLTALGTAIGTAAYMPPEQAEGQAVDERADVYAMGAMLYHLLAGEMPFADAKSHREILERLVAGPPAALGTLAADIPPDLLTIVERAMARRADERYPNAKALADDLKRFQAGNLVSVHHYSAAALFWRWIRNHPATSAVAILLLVGGSLSLWQIRQERNRAEVSKASVEDLMSFMIVDLGEKLEPLGKLELLSLVAEKAHGYYAKQPIEWAEKERVIERFKVLLSLGLILEAKGDLAGAIEANNDALAIAQRNAAREADSLDWRLSLAKVHSNLGGAYVAQGEQALALEQLRAAEGVFSDLSSMHPGEEVKWDSKRASVLSKLGNLFRDTGKPDEALGLIQEALTLYRRQAQRFPETAAHQSSLADSIEELGAMRSVHGTAEAALENYTEALAIREELVDAAPEDFGLQRELSVARILTGDALRVQGRLDDALEMFQSSLVISQRLSAHDPQNAHWMEDLAHCHLRVGDIFRIRREPQKAIEHFSKALLISKELSVANPTKGTSKKTAASTYGIIGELYRQTKQLDKALASYLESKAITESLIAQTPNDTSLKRSLALINGMLGALYDSLKDADTARKYFSECAELFGQYGVNARDFYNGASCVALIDEPDLAFKLLEKAVDAGFTQREWLTGDESFEPLKKDPRWAALLARLAVPVLVE